jgi:hypothetical protein
MAARTVDDDHPMIGSMIDSVIGQGGDADLGWKKRLDEEVGQYLWLTSRV